MAKRKGYRRDTNVLQPRVTLTFANEGAQFAPERYPAPGYAATIWYTSEGLRVGLPATLGESGHTVVLPFRGASWTVLTEILRERARHAERAQRVIGTRSAPVQYDIEATIRAMGSSAPSVTRPQRTLTLDDLDGDVSDVA
jgi:hypothetical protein